MIKVSVAMGVYNGEKYLPEQLDSILDQLQIQDELVVSCDPSTDHSLAILQDYAARDARIIICDNDHPGLASNFDNAIRHCSGDYIFLSDQDDRWAKTKREDVVACFEKTGADMVIHNAVHINNTGRYISKPFFTIYQIGGGRISNLMKARYYACCMAFTRSMARHILPVPTHLTSLGQWVGAIGEYYGKISYLNQILLFHRLHETNATPRHHRPLLAVAKDRALLLKSLSLRTRRDGGIEQGEEED